MSEYINVNWELYKKVPFNNPNACPDCWAIWLHWCTWKRIEWLIPLLPNSFPWNYWINESIEETCAWDSMPETFPWSGQKMWMLYCNCKKCSPIF